MSIDVLFEKIVSQASKDEAFKKRLLEIYDGDFSIKEFCKECNDVGIEIYPMDIADADESMYAAMRRSTNGGGENSPHLNWQEEAFDALMEEIRKGN